MSKKITRHLVSLEDLQPLAEFWHLDRKYRKLGLAKRGKQIFFKCEELPEKVVTRNIAQFTDVLVEINREDLKEFKSLKIGDTFKYNDKKYMKVTKGKSFNAVMVEQRVEFRGDLKVIRLPRGE